VFALVIVRSFCARFDKRRVRLKIPAKSLNSANSQQDFRQAKEAFRSRRRPSIVIIVATVKVSEKILENFSDLLKFNFQITATSFFTVKIKKIRKLYRSISTRRRSKEIKKINDLSQRKSSNAIKKANALQKTRSLLSNINGRDDYSAASSLVSSADSLLISG
jgi:hypothetical protein